ncbi:hypothetical protein J7U46_16710 [Pelomonas sp. V22]|nr:hypothetical protein [Pelomonas sp. V22]
MSASTRRPQETASLRRVKVLVAVGYPWRRTRTRKRPLRSKIDDMRMIPVEVGSPVDQHCLESPLLIESIYDMCKAADRGMVMEQIRVLEKQGGKSGEWKAAL